MLVTEEWGESGRLTDLGKTGNVKVQTQLGAPLAKWPPSPSPGALGTACFRCPVHKGHQTRLEMVTQHDHTQEFRSGCPLNLDLKRSCSVTLPLLQCECAVTAGPDTSILCPARHTSTALILHGRRFLCEPQLPVPARAPRCRPFLPLQAGTGTEAAPQDLELQEPLRG